MPWSKKKVLRYIDIMNKCSRIYIAGHCGLVGSSIERKLLSKGFSNIIIRTRSQLDLANQEAVNKFFSEETLDIVIIAAAMVKSISSGTLTKFFVL